MGKELPLGQDTGAEASARVGAAQDGAGTGCHGGEERAVGCSRGSSAKGCVGKGWTTPSGSLPARTVPGPSLGTGETRRGHPAPRDVPIPSLPGAEELLSPPAPRLRAGINPGGSQLFPFLPRRVGSLRLLMPRLPCVAPISDVIFIDGWNDLYLSCAVWKCNI